MIYLPYEGRFICLPDGIDPATTPGRAVLAIDPSRLQVRKFCLQLGNTILVMVEGDKFGLQLGDAILSGRLALGIKQREG